MALQGRKAHPRKAPRCFRGVPVRWPPRVGLPDERLGEELAAVVMPKPERTILKEELCGHVAKHLAAFKVPAVILFRDEQLPRGATDKIDKRTLREQVMKELEKYE